MAEIPAAVRRSVNEFLAAVAKERRIITAAYLYGSETRGQAGPWSDIDVAVISPDFADNLFAAQLALMQLAAKVDERIEPARVYAGQLPSQQPACQRDPGHGHSRRMTSLCVRRRQHVGA